MARIIAMVLLAGLARLAAAPTSPATNSPAPNLPAGFDAPPAAALPATNSWLEGLPLIPEDVKLFDESLLWQHTVRLRTGAGYDDNVLLSPNARQGSAFVTEGLDGSLVRVPLDGWGVDLELSGDDVRYLQNVPPDGKDFWTASQTLKRYWGDHWQTGITGEETYLDEVDQVETLTGPEIAEIQGNIINIRPFLRRNLGSNWWAELAFPTAREILDAPLDNIWEYGPQLRLGLGSDQQRELALSYQIEEIDHDTWPALSADGVPVGSRILSLVEQRAELTWHQVWDAARRWSSDTKLTYVRDDDNGGGFFNFNEYAASARLRYRLENWEFLARAQGSYRAYPVQRTAVATGPTLNEASLQASVRAERRLTKWLKLYAEYHYERGLSNLTDIRYTADTAVAGLVWEF